MERLFYAPDIATLSELPEDESQHCIHVLRLSKGDSVLITDGKGYFYTALIENAHPKHCQVNIINHWQQKLHYDYTIHIAVAPPKNMDRMEWFVEKATEIGINTITFLRCCHSERKDIKLQRLVKTAICAMKQSQQATMPKINEMLDFYEFLASDNKSAKMIAYCAETRNPLIKNVYTAGQDSLIMIGPEGDFSKNEINCALSAGFTSVSLGESRLRTETAALIACHTIHLINA